MGRTLGLQWTFWKEYAPLIPEIQKQQTLWMNAKGKTPADARLLLATVEDRIMKHRWSKHTGNEKYSRSDSLLQ